MQFSITNFIQKLLLVQKYPIVFQLQNDSDCFISKGSRFRL